MMMSLRKVFSRDLGLRSDAGRWPPEFQRIAPRPGSEATVHELEP